MATSLVFQNLHLQLPLFQSIVQPQTTSATTGISTTTDIKTLSKSILSNSLVLGRRIWDRFRCYYTSGVGSHPETEVGERKTSSSSASDISATHFHWGSGERHLGADGGSWGEDLNSLLPMLCWRQWLSRALRRNWTNFLKYEAKLAQYNRNQIFFVSFQLWHFKQFLLNSHIKIYRQYFFSKQYPF